MKPRPRMFLLALLLCPLFAPAQEPAGWSYHFSVTHQEPIRESASSGQVLTDGRQYYVVFAPQDEPRFADAILFADSTKEEWMLNLENSTYFSEEPAGEPVYLPFLVVGREVKIKQPEVTVTEQEGETLLGYPTRKVEVRMTYRVVVDFNGNPVKASMEVEHLYWLTEALALPTPEAYRPIREIQIPEVDALLAEKAPNLEGFPLKWQRTVTSDIEQGATIVKVDTYTVDALERTTVDPDEFTLPETFRYQEPQVGIPVKGAPVR